MSVVPLWPRRKLLFVSSNKLKTFLFRKLCPPVACRFFPYTPEVRSIEVDPEIQGCRPVDITKHKVEKVRQIIGYAEPVDIVMEDSQLQLPRLQGLPGPMTKMYAPHLPDLCSSLNADREPPTRQRVHAYLQTRGKKKKLQKSLRSLMRRARGEEPADHLSTIYWDRGHMYAGSSFAVRVEGTLRPLQGDTGGFDEMFRPIGWNRRYREKDEPDEKSFAVRANLGCAITRCLVRFFIGVVARRGVEHHILAERQQLPSTAVLRQLLDSLVQRELRDWFATSGLTRSYPIAKDIDDCVQDLLHSGIGIGAQAVRVCPVSMEGLIAEGLLAATQESTQE